jgi:iron complex outermembrane receptor protein
MTDRAGRKWVVAVASGLAGLALLTTTSRSVAEPDVEVLVAGTAVERSASGDTTAASTVLRRGDLDAPGASAAAVLTRVPGVQVQQTGSSSDLATASLRGTTSAQTPVYLAGVRLNDDISGTADLSTVPLWMLDRVEVYRGNAPAKVDLLGMGGAVLFEPRYPTGDQVRAGVGWGSWGQRTGYIAAGTGSKKVQTLLALRRESARNDYAYWDNGGTAFSDADDHWQRRTNADQTTTDWWTVSRLSLGEANQVLLLANAFDREQGVPGLLAIPATQARVHIRRELVGLAQRSEVACGAHSPCRLSTATSFHRASVDFTDPSHEFGLGAAAASSLASRITHDTRFSWPFADGWLLAPSATLGAETLDVTRPDLAPLAAKRLQSSLGTSLEWRALGALTLIGIARLDVDSTQAASRDRAYRVPTGRIGAAYQVLPGLSLLANLGYYSRVPALGELYGTSALVAGNPNLERERGLVRDLGVRYTARAKRAAISIETFAFQQDLDDLVAWQRSSFRQIRPYNVGQARLRGVENYIGVDLLSFVHIESATTLLDPRDTTSGRNLRNDLLPFRSRLIMDARLQLHTPGPVSALRLQRASVSLHASHRSSRYQDRSGLIIVPHSTVFDLESGVQLGDVPLSVEVAVYNLFDQPRFDLVGYPLPPRTFALELALEWERTR